jgi:hypothetical protein
MEYGRKRYRHVVEAASDAGPGSGKTDIIARYDKVKNQNGINVVLHTGPAKFTAPGMVSLRTSTINGNLSFSDGTRTWPQ